MTLAPESINAVRARAFVVGCLTEHRLFSLIDPLRLVTSELVTNAILHAHTSVTVTLEQADDRVVLTVTDGSLAAPRRMPFDPLSVDGRGLILVDLLSADSGVTTDSTGGTKSVWASFLVRGGIRVSEQRSGQEDVAQAD